mmetsp:Transcript_160160/g.388929  ORF Transcript_160160/g.388929 Transcript_160160/m.388929 type:complete len:98 (-) Transcript_160160:6-299(-)
MRRSSERGDFLLQDGMLAALLPSEHLCIAELQLAWWQPQCCPPPLAGKGMSPNCVLPFGRTHVQMSRPLEFIAMLAYLAFKIFLSLPFSKASRLCNC